MYNRREQRGACPVCGYPKAYVETTGKNGARIGWCASCQNNEAIAALLRGAGLGGRRAAGDCGASPEKALEDSKKRVAAAVIWNGAAPVTPNDPAGKYFIRRVLAHLIGNPALRYRADVPHPGGGRYPAMVALVQDVAGKLMGVQRTYVAPDGNKARLEPVKASKGTIWGGAIRLAPPTAPEIVIGEGIETSASAGLLLGLPAWAAISAGNLGAGLVLPPEVRRVVIAADDDGMNAQGRNPGIEAAEAAARRWQAEGRDVRIIKPSQSGQDFNDVLRAQKFEGAA